MYGKLGLKKAVEHLFWHRGIQLEKGMKDRKGRLASLGAIKNEPSRNIPPIVLRF